MGKVSVSYGEQSKFTSRESPPIRSGADTSLDFWPARTAMQSVVLRRNSPRASRNDNENYRRCC